MNYEQAIRRVDELEAILKQREAHDKMTTCGCGDIRPAAEFCHICGKCQMGCCMCGRKMRGQFQYSEKKRAEIAQLRQELRDTKATYEPEIARLNAQLAANTALLEEAKRTIKDLQVALKWQNLKGGE